MLQGFSLEECCILGIFFNAVYRILMVYVEIRKVCSVSCYFRCDCCSLTQLSGEFGFGE